MGMLKGGEGGGRAGKTCKTTSRWGGNPNHFPGSTILDFLVSKLIHYGGEFKVEGVTKQVLDNSANLLPWRNYQRENIYR